MPYFTDALNTVLWHQLILEFFSNGELLSISYVTNYEGKYWNEFFSFNLSAASSWDLQAQILVFFFFLSPFHQLGWQWVCTRVLHLVLSLIKYVAVLMFKFFVLKSSFMLSFQVFACLLLLILPSMKQCNTLHGSWCSDGKHADQKKQQLYAEAFRSAT